jgi:hypothetical protein
VLEVMQQQECISRLVGRFVVATFSVNSLTTGTPYISETSATQPLSKRLSYLTSYRERKEGKGQGKRNMVRLAYYTKSQL